MHPHRSAGERRRRESNVNAVEWTNGDGGDRTAASHVAMNDWGVGNGFMRVAVSMEYLLIEFKYLIHLR